VAEYSNGLEDCLDLPDSSITVLEARYLTKDPISEKIIETGEQMFRRVAKDVAHGDAFYLEGLKGKASRNMTTQELYDLCEGDDGIKEREEEFYNLMVNRYFLANSPTLMNAGKRLQQLSACFVLPVEDSVEDIFESLKAMAIVHKSGGGTGFSFSRIRPNGAFIGSTQGYSPGPASFAFIYNEGAGQITQGGKRRGANMGVMRANHPDAWCWTRLKEDEKRSVNFNLSVAFTDDEIKAVKENGYIMMEDPREDVDYTVKNAKNRVDSITYGRSDKFETSWILSDDETKVIDKYSGEEIGKVENDKIHLEARKLFYRVAEGAWKKGDPGIIFIDRLNAGNPTPELGEIESTNPCGEQPLLPYESCNLGSINLSEMVGDGGKLDESLLEKTTRSAVRFLDNVIDRNKYPMKEIEEMTLANRKIGLGVMGFAHMLSKEGLDYRSEEAVERAEYVMEFINRVSKDESRELAKERGAFPNFKQSVYKDQEPIRNATTTTIAPTGTTGVIFSTSQSIEPIIRLIASRNVEGTIGKNLVERDRAVFEYLESRGLYDEDLIEKMVEKGLTFDDLLIPKGIKDEMKGLFPTALEIHYEQHIKIQAAFQKHTDNAVSKTTNMPNDATVEDVMNVYLLAHESGCKGITIYREGSRDVQLLTSAGKKEDLEGKVLRGRDIPGVIGLHGITYEIKTGCGPLFVTANVDGNGLVEIFNNMNPPGGCSSAQSAATGIALSLGFHKGTSPESIANHYRALRCPKENLVLNQTSCSQAIAMGIDYIKEDMGEKIRKGDVFPIRRETHPMHTEEGSPKTDSDDYSRKGLNVTHSSLCPECNTPLDFSGGCRSGACPKLGCSWSTC